MRAEVTYFEWPDLDRESPPTEEPASTLLIECRLDLPLRMLLGYAPMVYPPLRMSTPSGTSANSTQHE